MNRWASPHETRNDLGALLRACAQSQALTNPLPSNDGPAKPAIVQFVRTTIDKTSPHSRPPRPASPPSIRMAQPGSSNRCTR